MSSPVPKARLLMVDDEPAILLSYQAILKAEGYAVSIASTIAQALAMVNASQFDLVLCDLALANRESGLDILLHARRKDPNVAAVLLTGYPDPNLPKELSRDRMQVLYKPVEVPRLLAALDFLLRGRRIQSESASESA